MIDLGKNKKVTASLKIWNWILFQEAQHNIYLKSEKFTLFNALNDSVDQTFGTFF